MPIETGTNEAILKQILLIYNEAEQQMFEKIMTTVDISDDHWVAIKHSELNKIRKEIQEILYDANHQAKKYISKSIIDAYLSGKVEASKDLKMPYNVLSTMDQVPNKIKRLVLETNNLIDNTMIYVLRKTNDEYRKIIADVSAMELLGVQTPKQAMQQALNNFAAKGITGFIDKSGRRWELASYVEMAVRTTTSHAALMGHIDRCIELDHDLVKVSNHNASCPICAPWGGKVLSISGNSKKYPSLEEAKLAGLFHPNCKHTVYAYFEDIYNDAVLKPDEQNYENDSDLYQATQKQRYNERQIRKWKRMESVAITPEAKQKAQQKIRYWQEQQRILVNQYNLKRNYWRESIKGRQGNATKAWNKLENFGTASKGLTEVSFEEIWDYGQGKIKINEAPPTVETPKKTKSKQTKQQKIEKMIQENIARNFEPLTQEEIYEGVREAEQWFNLKENDKYKFAFYRYTTDDYIWMNKYYRDKFYNIPSLDLSDAEKKMLKDMNEAFSIAPNAISKDTVLYRATGNIFYKNLLYTNTGFDQEGHQMIKSALDALSKITSSMLDDDKVKEYVGELEDIIKKKVVGKIGLEASYTSTSYEYGVFGRSSPVQLIIKAPKGIAQGIHLSPVSTYGDSEAEILLKPGTKYKITDCRVEPKPNKDGLCTRIEIEIIGVDESYLVVE